MELISETGARRRDVRPWTTEENRVVRLHFLQNLQGKTTTVSAAAIRECIKSHRCLQGRTEAQLRSKVNNIMKGKEKL